MTELQLHRQQAILNYLQALARLEPQSLEQKMKQAQENIQEFVERKEVKS